MVDILGIQLEVSNIRRGTDKVKIRER